MSDDDGVVCSTLAYRELPLSEGLERIAALGFGSIELGIYDDYTHLTAADLAADPAGVRRHVADTVERAGLRTVSLNSAVPLDTPQGARDQLGHLLELAAAAGAGIVTIEAPARGTRLEDAAAMLAPLVAQAQAAGVGLSVETHVFFVTEVPGDAARLAELVPGLGVTLDPAHFSAGPGQGHPLDELYPYVRHLHVRDAGTIWADIQTDMGAGVVDFPGVFASLREHGFDGLRVIEYIGAGQATGIERNVRAARACVREGWA